MLVEAVRGILHGTARVLDISDRIEVAKIVRSCLLVVNGIERITAFVPARGPQGNWTQADVDRLSEILRSTSDDASRMVDAVKSRLPELAPWPEILRQISDGVANMERYWPLLGNAVRCEVEADVAGQSTVQAKGVKHIWAQIIKDLCGSLQTSLSTDPDNGGSTGIGVLDELREEFQRLGIEDTVGGAELAGSRAAPIDHEPQPELANKALTKLVNAAKRNDAEGVRSAADELRKISDNTALLAEDPPNLTTNPSAEALRKLALTLTELAARSGKESVRSLLAHAFALVGQITAVHDQVASYTIGSCQRALYAIEEESELVMEDPMSMRNGDRLDENLDAVRSAVNKAADCGLVGRRDRDAVVGRVEDLKHLVPIVSAAAQLAAAVSEVVGGATAKEHWDGVKGAWQTGVKRLRETVGSGIAENRTAEFDTGIMIGAAKHIIKDMSNRLFSPEVMQSPSAAKHVLKSLLERVAECTSIARNDAEMHGEQEAYSAKVLDECDALEHIAINIASKASVLLDDAENSAALVTPTYLAEILEGIRPDVEDLGLVVDRLDGLIRVETRRRKAEALPTIYEEEESAPSGSTEEWVPTVLGETKEAVMDGKEVMIVDAAEPQPMESEQAAKEPLKVWSYTQTAIGDVDHSSSRRPPPWTCKSPPRNGPRSRTR
ncbi:hypothetical protein DFJ74DRAFT_426871 [Hyaloraphidium curvatum]|nr:hypothetical protein DFJ74DRAFT_426871 [Hyaloraphidium curvatum]